MGWSLLAPVADDGAGALYYLAGLAFGVDLAETSPLTKLHVRIDLKKRKLISKFKKNIEYNVCLKNVFLKSVLTI